MTENELKMMIEEQNNNDANPVLAAAAENIMEFNGCMSLKTVDISSLDFSKMVMLDEMTSNQIEWCKEKGIIENLKPEVAKELNMCAFYALITSDLIDEFDAL